jgi:hypothetical protein
MRAFLLTMLCSVLVISASDAQERMRIGHNAVGFHKNPCGIGGASIRVYAASENVLADVGWMAEEAGLVDLEVRQSNLKQNACALIYDGKRYIVLGTYIDHDGDPEEKWALDFVVLAHEIGHHACGHTGYTNNIADNWRQELEADRYSGMLIGRLVEKGNMEASYAEGFLLDFVVNVMARGSGYRGGETHPPDEDRKRAVREGYETKTAC